MSSDVGTSGVLADLCRGYMHHPTVSADILDNILRSVSRTFRNCLLLDICRCRTTLPNSGTCTLFAILWRYSKLALFIGGFLGRIGSATSRHQRFRTDATAAAITAAFIHSDFDTH
ncbi:hypothetical protein BD410DRAFT_287974 [Rickenella mellea]|uniref:Uncharacterized protein n=1 Tax=Rickenella mellea TaxID=50990 RepID=A0A4Y7Q236_9AGAM|nr:hypothetical protein BD410DRAFT_287974 [Rickenella mellea]